VSEAKRTQKLPKIGLERRKEYHTTPCGAALQSRNSSSKKNEKKKLGIFVDARDSPWAELNDHRRGFPLHEVIRGMGFVFLGQHESGVGPFAGHHKRIKALILSSTRSNVQLV